MTMSTSGVRVEQEELETIKKSVLISSRRLLVDSIDPANHLSYLRSKFIFDERDAEEISAPPSRSAKAEVFLDKLCRKGSQGYDEFENSLCRDKTQLFLLTHMTKTLELLKHRVRDFKVQQIKQYQEQLMLQHQRQPHIAPQQQQRVSCFQSQQQQQKPNYSHGIPQQQRQNCCLTQQQPQQRSHYHQPQQQQHRSNYYQPSVTQQPQQRSNYCQPNASQQQLQQQLQQRLHQQVQHCQPQQYCATPPGYSTPRRHHTPTVTPPQAPSHPHYHHPHPHRNLPNFHSRDPDYETDTFDDTSQFTNECTAQGSPHPLDSSVPCGQPSGQPCGQPV